MHNFTQEIIFYSTTYSFIGIFKILKKDLVSCLRMYLWFDRNVRIVDQYRTTEIREFCLTIRSH